MALIFAGFALVLKVWRKTRFKRTAITGIRVSTHEPWRKSEVDRDARYDLTFPTRTSDFPFAFLPFPVLFFISLSLAFFSLSLSLSFFSFSLCLYRLISNWILLRHGATRQSEKLRFYSWSLSAQIDPKRRTRTSNQNVWTIQSQSVLNSNYTFKAAPKSFFTQKRFSVK